MSKIIAEIGCNHKSDLEIAKEHIKIAAEFCKVDVVKFQKRNNKTLLSEEVYNSPHPVPENSYGSTYGRDITNVKSALSYKETDILPIEFEQRKKLKWLG